MFAILRRLPELDSYLDEMEVAMTDWAYTAWKEYRDWYEKLVVECDQKSGGKYLTYMLDTLRKELKKTWKDRMSYLRGAIEDEDIVQSFQPLQERGRIGFGTYDPSQTVAPPR